MSSWGVQQAYNMRKHALIYLFSPWVLYLLIRIQSCKYSKQSREWKINAKKTKQNAKKATWKYVSHNLTHVIRCKGKVLYTQHTYMYVEYTSPSLWYRDKNSITPHFVIVFFTLVNFFLLYIYTLYLPLSFLRLAFLPFVVVFVAVYVFCWNWCA